MKNNIPLSEYPRPQFKRDSYLCLNGTWDIEFSFSHEIPSSFQRKVVVPFPIESTNSTLSYKLKKGEYIYYKKVFSLPKDFNKGRVILHFDSVDQIADVYVNNKHLMKHVGGYNHFEVDITNVLKAENILILRVKDDLDITLPYGKQSWKSHGMWYTKCSGIYKTVWLESVPTDYIKGLKIDTSLNEVKIKIDSNIKEKKIIIHTEKGDIVNIFEDDNVSIKIEDAINWTVENPYLYQFEIFAGEDHVSSYFALREISIIKENGHSLFALNGQKIFLNGVLDQGYFMEGIFTPQTYQEYEKDIMAMKNLGFNTLRKHIKIEPEYFYYLCDKIGMLVMQDFVNFGKYSFLLDTVLPTIGMKRINDKYRHKKGRENFNKHIKETICQLYNHPSVIYYTIFNEGWGQFCAKKGYEMVKNLDSSRIIDTASGWFIAKKSDVISEHVYFKKIKLKKHYDKPIIISEFGGYSYIDQEHNSINKSRYGYGHFNKLDEYQNAVKKLYDTQITPFIFKPLAGCVYTQLSDVENETNGLLTYDRKICKIKEPLIK